MFLPQRQNPIPDNDINIEAAMQKKIFSRLMTVGCFALFATLAQGQLWTPLTNPPSALVTSCMLLTDGGVMCQSGVTFYKLTPDINGSYVNGTWSTLASLPAGYEPLLYASAVLA